MTLAGSSPARVTTVQNAANPGTRTLTFATGNQPIWHASGGLNGRPYAEFDGSDDIGIAGGFSFSQQNGTNEIVMQIVGRYRDVVDKWGASGVFASATANRDHHFRTFHVWSSLNFDFFRTNGYPVGYSHNIDYLTPEASNDTAWQLHEGYAKATGLIVFRNGTQYGTGGGGGGLITTPTAPIDEIRVAATMAKPTRPSTCTKSSSQRAERSRSCPRTDHCG